MFGWFKKRNAGEDGAKTLQAKDMLRVALSVPGTIHAEIEQQIRKAAQSGSTRVSIRDCRLSSEDVDRAVAALTDHGFYATSMESGALYVSWTCTDL